MQPQLYGICYLLSKVMPSFSDITDVSTIGLSFKTDKCCNPLFHIAKYGDEIIGRELNLDENCRSVVGVEPTTFRTAGPKSIKTNALTNSAAMVYIP